MLIVLEGCDGVGKTYLAERLRTEIEARGPGYVDVLHRGVPTRPLSEEYDLSWYRPGEKEHYVLDRWHLGEWVYGRLYRGRSELGIRGLARIDRQLRSMGALRIILDEDFIEIAERLADKGEDYLQPQHQTHVLSEYKMLAAHFGWQLLSSYANPIILVDWAQSLEEQAVGAW
jgi:thymidylate kinase